MKIFHSNSHQQHAPAFEVFDGGVRVPNFEMPERITRIVNALKQTSWAEFVAPQDFGIDPILAVHDADYIDFLRTAYDEWGTAPVEGSNDQYDRSALMPATFPPRGWARKPTSLLGKAGYYTMDLSAPILAGTWQAVYDSAQIALSGAKAIINGDRIAFALCRPPGHHAGRSTCGGYCYVNNAAVAAQWLAQKTKVALLDIDYHAGNGTQDIFYASDRVLTVSIHADPSTHYPYYSGYADEIGSGAGENYHRNFPLPAKTDDRGYISALDQALDHIRRLGAQQIIVSAGMDIYAGDPLGDFKVTSQGINQIGEHIAALNIPALVVMEGGYNNEALGTNVKLLLEGLTAK